MRVYEMSSSKQRSVETLVRLSQLPSVVLMITDWRRDKGRDSEETDCKLEVSPTLT